MATAGAKIIVASKLPMRLTLQLCEWRDTACPDGRGGLHHEKTAVKVGQIVMIEGTAYPRGEPPEGFRDKPQMVAGCALTYGVDKDFWDAWTKQNKGFPALESGLIFAFEKRDAVQKAAKERTEVTSGLDPMIPLRPNGPRDPRWPANRLKGIVVEGMAGPTDLDAAT